MLLVLISKMDIIFSYLIDPMEIEMELANEINQSDKSESQQTHPDEFRPFLFNDPTMTLTVLIENEFDSKKLMKKSSIPEKYWFGSNENLISLFEARIIEYVDSTPHLLTDELTGRNKLNPSILKYYHSVYDNIDLLIIRSVSNDLLVTVLTRLLGIVKDNSDYGILVFRFIIYISCYFIKMNYHRRSLKDFTKVTYKKLSDLQETPSRVNVFTKTELENYLSLCQSYDSQ